MDAALGAHPYEAALAPAVPVTRHPALSVSSEPVSLSEPAAARVAS